MTEGAISFAVLALCGLLGWSTWLLHRALTQTQRHLFAALVDPERARVGLDEPKTQPLAPEPTHRLFVEDTNVTPPNGRMPHGAAVDEIERLVAEGRPYYPEGDG